MDETPGQISSSKPPAIESVETEPQENLEQTLLSLGFPPPLLVAGRTSVADLFRSNDRCGLFVLIFENGECHPGQTQDISRQYASHARAEVDIAWLAFRPIPQEQLEQEAIHLTNALRGRAMRQAMSEMLPQVEADFDLVMEPANQRRWLMEMGYIDSGGRRPTDAGLRQKYRRNYERLLRAPFAMQTISILHTYVQQAIPAPRRSEVAFWSLSCMPTHWVYTRVNLHWQETLSAYVQNGQLWFSLHLALSPLEKVYGQGLFKLRRRHPLAAHIDHQFVPGGADQTSFDLPAGIARSFITDPGILPAIRLFNLRLMRKGPCTTGRYHCLDLTDQILETE
jgi:hypothetical protein